MNIIDLSARKQSILKSERHCVFFLNETGARLKLLSTISFAKIVDIRDPITLRLKLAMSPPDLILIDSDSSWLDPIEMILELNEQSRVPIVLICNQQYKRRHPNLLKQAFAAGLHDTLYTPLCLDDVEQTFGVLLKLRRKACHI